MNVWRAPPDIPLMKCKYHLLATTPIQVFVKKEKNISGFFKAFKVDNNVGSSSSILSCYARDHVSPPLLPLSPFQEQLRREQERGQEHHHPVDDEDLSVVGQQHLADEFHIKKNHVAYTSRRFPNKLSKTTRFIAMLDTTLHSTFRMFSSLLYSHIVYVL